jgi:CRISPR-associated protein Cas1
VVFLSRYGKFRGRLVHTGSKFAQLRHAQLQKMSDEAVSLSIAQQVVQGKLHNQQALLTAKMEAGPAREKAVESITRMQARAKTARNVDTLRGFEGSAGASYWGAFRTLLPEGLGFDGRKYFPPPDPVNALLSFGYSLLLKDVTAAVQLVGLDPYLGFFHVIDYGRPSLALDMMEEFRPLLVDQVVLGLLAEPLLAPADFEWTGNPKRPVRLGEALGSRLIEGYEQRLSERVLHPDGGGQTAYRRVIVLQVRRLARVMLGQAQGYRAFVG